MSEQELPSTSEAERIGSYFPSIEPNAQMLHERVRHVWEHDGRYYVTTGRSLSEVEMVLDGSCDFDDLGQGLNHHPTKKHCTKTSSIDYDYDAATFGEVVSVPGECQDCGAEVEFIYDRVGIWDPDEDEYITEF